LIFEIIREATTNAIYHGDATKILVTFREYFSHL
jgi:signal transduction histidine kinase